MVCARKRLTDKFPEISKLRITGFNLGNRYQFWQTFWSYIKMFIVLKPGRGPSGLGEAILYLLCDDGGELCISIHYHDQIGIKNHKPLFRVMSSNNAIQILYYHFINGKYRTWCYFEQEHHLSDEDIWTGYVLCRVILSPAGPIYSIQKCDIWLDNSLSHIPPLDRTYASVNRVWISLDNGGLFVRGGVVGVGWWWWWWVDAVSRMYASISYNITRSDIVLSPASHNVMKHAEKCHSEIANMY